MWNFDMQNPIAQGGMATIHKGVWCGIDVVVKVIRGETNLGSETQKQLIQEVKLLASLRHNNIILLYGVSIDTHISLMVLEFAEGGSLYSYLRNHPEKINGPEVVNHFMHQISLGMTYLHRHDPPILHGDLKAANCLLRGVKYGALESIVKISDFGFSRIQSDSISSRSKENVSGTLCWIAPERLDAGKLSKMVDVYAFAMTSYEILTIGKLPFELNGLSDINIVGALFRKERPVRPPTNSPPIFLDEQWDLIQRCWSQDPNLRPTFADISVTLKTIASKLNDGSNLASSETNFNSSRSFETTNYNQYVSRIEAFESGQKKSSSDSTSSSSKILQSRFPQAELSPISKYDEKIGFIEVVQSQNDIELNSKPSKKSSKNYMETSKVEDSEEQIAPLLLVSNEAEKIPLWKTRPFLITAVIVGLIIVAIAIVTGIIVAQNSGSHRDPIFQTPRPTVSPGTIIRNYTGHTDFVKSVAVLSGNPPRLFSGSPDTTIREWDTKTGQVLRTLTGNNDLIFKVEIIPGNPPRLFSGAYSFVREWDLTSGLSITALTEPKVIMLSMAVLAGNSPRLFASSFNGVLEWDLTSKQMVRTYANIDYILSVTVLSGDAPRLFSADKTIREWDLNTGQIVRDYTGHTDFIRSLFVLPGLPGASPRLFSGSDDNTIREWDTVTGRTIRTYTGHTGSVYSIAAFGNPLRLFSGSADKTIREWDTTTGQTVRTYSGHSSTVFSLKEYEGPNQSQPSLFSGGDKTIIEWGL